MKRAEERGRRREERRERHESNWNGQAHRPGNSGLIIARDTVFGTFNLPTEDRDVSLPSGGRFA